MGLSLPVPTTQHPRSYCTLQGLSYPSCQLFEDNKPLPPLLHTQGEVAFYPVQQQEAKKQKKELPKVGNSDQNSQAYCHRGMGSLTSSSSRQWDEKGTAPPPTVRAAGQEAEDVVSVELSEQACSSGFGSCCL